MSKNQDSQREQIYAILYDCACGVDYDKSTDAIMSLISQDRAALLERVEREVIGDDKLELIQRPPMLHAKASNPHEVREVIEINQRIDKQHEEFFEAQCRFKLRAEQRKALNKIKEESV